MSNIILILLWLTPDKIKPEIREKVAYAGAVYSADSVNYIIKSLYETYLFVDTVVVYGPDLNKIGDLIINALRGICNEALRIPCEYVKELGVYVVDLRWKSEEKLREAVYRLYRPRDTPARPRRALTLFTPERRLPYLGAHVIYDTDVDVLRLKAIDYVLTYGVETPDVLYNVLILQRAPRGSYAAATCDLIKDWPCGLDKAAVLITTPAYITKEDVAKAKALVKDIPQSTTYDPHGNFYIGDRLYHYSPEGTLLRVLEISDVTMKREAAKLLPDHAFYLGGEYAAMRLLKDKYVQDRWRAETPPE
ncbi:MAG: thymidylate synthase [Pyrobaculum sp.]